MILKSILLYYKEISSFNIPFSLLIGFLSFSADGKFLTGFTLSLLTGGMLLALYLYERRYKEKYYFYFNLGYSKVNLIVYTTVLNVIIIILFFTLEKAYHGWQ